MIEKNKIDRNNTKKLIDYSKNTPNPNNQKFFFTILNDFSFIPFQYWWSNLLFTTVYVLLVPDDYLGLTMLSSTVIQNYQTKAIYDAMFLSMLASLVLITLLYFIVGLRGTTKIKIQDSVNWMKRGEVLTDSDEVKQLRRFMKLMVFFPYLLTLIVFFFTNQQSLISNSLINSNVFILILCEMLYVAILTIMTCYFIAKEI